MLYQSNEKRIRIFDRRTNSGGKNNVFKNFIVFKSWLAPVVSFLGVKRLPLGFLRASLFILCAFVVVSFFVIFRRLFLDNNKRQPGRLDNCKMSLVVCQKMCLV